jgi:5-methyltetrahydrofolate--homocysteine methyltransferase
MSKRGRVNILVDAGSTPQHIAAMAKAVAGLAPRSVLVPVRTRLAGLEPFTMAA